MKVNIKEKSAEFWRQFITKMMIVTIVGVIVVKIMQNEFKLIIFSFTSGAHSFLGTGSLWQFYDK